MGTEHLPFLHIAPWIKGRGGVETLLKLHRAGDGLHGLAASQLSLFDRPPAVTDEAYETQSFWWKSSPRRMRSAMQRALHSHAGAMMCYHNAWGLPWFADVDGASRRLVYLHTNENDFRAWLPSLAPWVDGVVCVNPLAAEAVLRLLPDWDRTRLFSVTLPISPLIPGRSPRPPGDEIVVGYAGRLVRAQKRSERLVPFVAELKKQGTPFRLEVLGDGPLRPWLERKLAHEPDVEFLGWLEGAELWRRLRGWDVAVTFSEMEGGPILLVEEMRSGALPIYPAMGGSLGDLYGPQLDSNCLYPPGDLAAAARAVGDLFAQPAEVLAAKRARGEALAELHQRENYAAEFAAFAHRIAVRPRISQESRRQRRSRWSDVLPLGAITRGFPAELWR